MSGSRHRVDPGGRQNVGGDLDDERQGDRPAGDPGPRGRASADAVASGGAAWLDRAPGRTFVPRVAPARSRRTHFCANAGDRAIVSGCRLCAAGRWHSCESATPTSDRRSRVRSLRRTTMSWSAPRRCAGGARQRDGLAWLAQTGIPRLCRGGSRSSTVPEVETPACEPLKASREGVLCRTTRESTTSS